MKNITYKLILWILVLSMLASFPLSLVSCNNISDEQTEPQQTTNVTEPPVETEIPVASILKADLEKYAVVRPEKIGDDLKGKINSFYQRLNKDFGVAECFGRGRYCIARGVECIEIATRNCKG